MVNQKLPVVTVYLVIQSNNGLEEIKKLIEKNHNKPNIVMVKKPDIFGSLIGLLNLVEEHQNDGLVYIKCKEFSQDSIRLAAKINLPFVQLMKSSVTNEWMSFCINKIKRPKRIRRRNRNRECVGFCAMAN